MISLSLRWNIIPWVKYPGWCGWPFLNYTSLLVNLLTTRYNQIVFTSNRSSSFKCFSGIVLTTEFYIWFFISVVTRHGCFKKNDMTSWTYFWEFFFLKDNNNITSFDLLCYEKSKRPMLMAHLHPSIFETGGLFWYHAEVMTLRAVFTMTISSHCVCRDEKMRRGQMQLPGIISLSQGLLAQPFKGS